MPKVTVRGPLGKLKLSNNFRFKPDAVLHLLPCERPLCVSFLREVKERAVTCLETLLAETILHGAAAAQTHYAPYSQR